MVVVGAAIVSVARLSGSAGAQGPTDKIEGTAREVEGSVIDTVANAAGDSRVEMSGTTDETEGRRLYELGDGQWNIPALRELLEDIIPHHTTVEEFEVERDFPTIGRRTMLLNARTVFYEGNNSTSLLVAIEDVTDRRALEREKDELLRQKDLLLQEKDEVLRQKDLLLQEMN